MTNRKANKTFFIVVMMILKPIMIIFILIMEMARCEHFTKFLWLFVVYRVL